MLKVLDLLVLRLEMLDLLTQLRDDTLRLRLSSLRLVLVDQVRHLVVYLVGFDKVLWPLQDPVVDDIGFLSHDLDVGLL